MGSGKSTVGRLLAHRLAFDFVDTDALVEARAGQTVANLFRTLGEPAFRALESRALESLRDRDRVVVATGGGAPAQQVNRWFFQGSNVFHLRVSLETVRQRTAGDRDRPLLALEEPALRALFENRQPVYESLGAGVPTDGREPAEIAEEIFRKLSLADGL